MYQARYRAAHRVDGSYNPSMIRVFEQGGEIPNLRLSGAAGTGGGYYHNLIGTLANLRASVSYVTGAHNMKFGYQGGFNNPSQTYNHDSRVIFIRMKDGVVNQLTQSIVPPVQVKYVRNLLPMNFYAQDQWTTRPADAARRRPLRPYDLLVSRFGDRRPGLSVRATGGVLPLPARRPDTTGAMSRRGWVSPMTCSATARRRSSSTSGSTCKPSRRPTATST